LLTDDTEHNVLLLGAPANGRKESNNSDSGWKQRRWASGAFFIFPQLWSFPLVRKVVSPRC